MFEAVAHDHNGRACPPDEMTYTASRRTIMSEWLIEDGYTRTKTIPARAGFHPAVEVVYRPALSKDRHAYGAKLKAGDPGQIETFETDLITRQVVSMNGTDIKGKAARIHPLVRADVVDLVLSYLPADEAADLGN